MARAAVVAGVGGWVPTTAVSNEELVSWWDSDTHIDAEWIRTRTGIERRHVLAHGEATSDLAVAAGRRALDSAGTAGADALVVATGTPDQLSPAIAPDVAARLGLGPIGAFDVGAVCTGFLYALAAAAGLIAAEAADSVLVIGADAFSTVLDPADLATRALFGDGAGAVLLRAGATGERGALSGFHLGSDGTRRTLIEIPGGGSRQRSTGLPVKEEDTYFRMQGRAVFAQAVNRMSESARHTAAHVGWPVAEIDRWVLHQANVRVIAAVARGLGVPLDRFVTNIAHVGNTAAASVPLTLAAGLASGELRPGHRTVLAGFGGGLTWGSVALVWPELPPPPHQ
ncbi:MAG: beta-ketoacyl-ACP synthase 3 [Actinophytocola sp.]|uniref:beta-ketoacyl-ACP synthase 3 n=1 Tax=Actinophytocola sp. TaxID=1872138 RepID=UPI0013268C7F|nr:beta-ketoacyl-ACP synthase 3 [Actinophytocola sp.]MPZ83086.1 beta-ketoacyl-ACP synthase 3 [Actinophytocola sp.]